MLSSVRAPQLHRSHSLVSLKDYFVGPNSINSRSVGVTEQSLTSDILCSVAEAGDGAALKANPGHQTIPILAVKNGYQPRLWEALTSVFIPEHINCPFSLQVSFPRV